MVIISRSEQIFALSVIPLRVTNGVWSTYSTMAVRTSGPGPTGLSLLLVPLLDYPGVAMRRLKVTGSASGGTTFITLSDVKVPVENLIGEEGLGMKYIMTNFNHERLTIAIGATRQARVALAAAFEYCLQREAFGKTLMDQPVVRHRLAKCGALLESQWAWIEQFVYQMTRLSKVEADVELGGMTALAKANAGMVLEECGRCAVLLFGGNGLTRTGKGELVERKSSHSSDDYDGQSRHDNSLLTRHHRTVPRDTSSPYPGWFRRRHARPGRQAACQKLSTQDQDARTTSGNVQALRWPQKLLYTVQNVANRLQVYDLHRRLSANG